MESTQINQEFQNIQYNNIEYIYNPLCIKFNHIKNWTAKLKSGLQASFNQETQESTIRFTEEYALAELEVLEQMIKVTYSIDFELDQLNTELIFSLLENMKKSPFFTKLQLLNK